LHDSQAAIPLAQMSSERVTNLYDLMDAAYDSPEIHAFSKSLGHRPIIDSNPRRGEKILMDPQQNIALRKEVVPRESTQISRQLRRPQRQSKGRIQSNGSFDVRHCIDYSNAVVSTAVMRKNISTY